MTNDFLDQNEIDALINNRNQTDQTADLTDEERDTLAEIGNISMGSAATALSTLIEEKVTITVPSVEVTKFADIQETYPIPCIIVDIKYETGLKGSNLLVIKERDAAVIGSLMMGMDDTDIPEEIDELTLSALTEAMNVMMGSAATSMSDLFGKRINISPPVTTKQNLAEEISEDYSQKSYAVIAFDFNISNMVASTLLQVIDIAFAKEMVANLFAIEDEKLQSDPKEEVATETTWDQLKQDDSTVDNSAPYVEDALGNLNIELIKDIPVQIRAILGKTRMSIENILNLGPGHIMELDTYDGEPVEVYANDRIKSVG